ncbi:MAG TPA: hypothetical protein VI039_06945 [Solirubrobacterales bacterium]
MSTTGPKKKGGGAAGRKGRGRPKRSKAKQGGVPSKAETFMDMLLPEPDGQSGTAFADRRTRRSAVHKMEKTFARAEHAFDRIERALDEEEGMGEDRLWNDRNRRRLSDEDSRERSEDRADARLDVWIEERRRYMRQRDVLLGLSVLTTLAAIALAYMAVKHNQVEYAGVSIFSTALSGVELFFMRVAQDRYDEVGAIPGEPPHFRWSVLEFQPEIEQTSEPDDAAFDEEPPG